MQLCHQCRKEANYIICEDCGNLSVDPNNILICVFCSNPQAGQYYQNWLKNHPEWIPAGGDDSPYDDTNYDALQLSKLEEEAVNNYTCPNCQNKRCNINEGKCWSCGSIFPRSYIHE
jgi:ribosomal protein L37AE/L43A